MLFSTNLELLKAEFKIRELCSGWVCCIPTRGGDGVDKVVDVVVGSVAEAATVTVVKPAAVTTTVRFVVVVASVALVACECVRLEGWG